MHVPRTACGQYVTRFMSGYRVTMEREDAPRRILRENDGITRRMGRARCADAPVRVELQQDAESDGQLTREETERLAARDVATRERPRTRPL